MIPYTYRNLVMGVDTKIPLDNGNYTVSINMDNAATTPPFVQVLQEIVNFAPMYSSVHRGSGCKSRFSTDLYEASRVTIANFVKADPAHDTVIFVKNTTEAINKLSYRLCNGNEKSVVLSTEMEHHSNDLPWRNKFRVDYVGVDINGRLSLNSLVEKLEQYQGDVILVAVTGASNVTGYLNPIHEIAEIAHKYQAKILVDGAQMVPHIQIDMKPFDSSQHIDYLAFSGHKMYAPFGAGVLIGPIATFKKGAPEYTGGGTVRTVTRSNVTWADPPHKEEAGTPNLMGVLALQAAAKVLNTVGMENISRHEVDLWKYTVNRLRSIPGIVLHCDLDPGKPRIGIIPFSLDGIHHSLVADIMSGEAGIAVRSGCFCAQPYVRKLIKLAQAQTCKKDKQSRDRPGVIRISYGLYNDFREIDVLIQSLSRIVERKDYYIKKYGKP
ncbi:MAG: aminotransferase class V-fold PLP-dependent enzyme [Desulfotomaculaceae bacterium]|nr:aminotransferase class V-fold PLP-dependent enzyme [Desulfotomaculaceae bacterium]